MYAGLVGAVVVSDCCICIQVGDCRCVYVTYNRRNIQADCVTGYFKKKKMDDQFIIAESDG